MTQKTVFLLFLASVLLLEVCKAETRPIGPEGVEFASIEELRKFSFDFCKKKHFDQEAILKRNYVLKKTKLVLYSLTVHYFTVVFFI